MIDEFDFITAIFAFFPANKEFKMSYEAINKSLYKSLEKERPDIYFDLNGSLLCALTRIRLLSQRSYTVEGLMTQLLKRYQSGCKRI